jgi:hypothetical protein
MMQDNNTQGSRRGGANGRGSMRFVTFLVIAIVVSQILAAVSLTGQDCKRLPTPEIYTVSPANSSLFAAPASIYFRASLAGCTAPVMMAGCRHFA